MFAFFGKNLATIPTALEIWKEISYTTLDMNVTGLQGIAHLHPQLQHPLAHAYIISGPEMESCRNLASAMARSLVCRGPGERPCNTCAPCIKAMKNIHPDILVTAPSEASAQGKILVPQIREITGDLHILPNEANHKVYLVEQADAMNPEAQNAFLKALEEPPPFVTFLLLAENPAALFPTVRSRCAHLCLAPTEEHLPVEELPLVEDFFQAFSADSLKLLQFCVALEKADRNTLAAFIESCHIRLVEALKQEGPENPRLMAALDLFDSLRIDLRFNVNTGHIAGKIAASLL